MQARNHLAVIRQKRGISVVTLAAQVGVKRQTIYAIEAGRYIPNTVVALKLAQVLEVSVEDLFSIEEKPGAAHSYEQVDLLVTSGGETLQPGQVGSLRPRWQARARCPLLAHSSRIAKR